ncbi:MAG: Crp/Fnr family transcriptional regulator [Pseudomonadota bacterium]
MDEYLNALFDDGETRQADAGTYLFHAGDPVKFVHVILCGAVHLERLQVHGQLMCFQRARRGDVLAEASIYADAYHCDARAVEPTHFCRIRVDRFMERLQSDHAMSQAWAARLARTVQTTRLLAEIRGLKTVAERLDAWIDHNGALPPKGQWQDVAHELAVSREALYREIARRRGDGARVNANASSQLLQRAT